MENVRWKMEKGLGVSGLTLHTAGRMFEVSGSV